MDTDEALKILTKAKEEGRKTLLEHEAKKLCEIFGIPIAKSFLAKTSDEALKIANKLGYPVVLKIVSPDILHKTDVGGVIVNIKNDKELVEAYNKILKNVREKKPEAKIEGILVQEMVPEGVEVIVGAIKDPFFGYAIMFGLGGIFVEILRDVSFRIVPLTEEDAYQMITEIKAYPILKGVRNLPPRDIESIVKILLNTSKLLERTSLIKELDLNPIMVYEKGKGAKVVDVKVILE
ncbi:MAG: acetyl-CoA synthetase [Desulfurococcales archaeon ex4484_217_2]|nr:MAG: acetyl-CoA synthetase [Desulfurococcales archaeon ex4484_217_2]